MHVLCLPGHFSRSFWSLTDSPVIIKDVDFASLLVYGNIDNELIRKEPSGKVTSNLQHPPTIAHSSPLKRVSFSRPLDEI